MFIKNFLLLSGENVATVVAEDIVKEITAISSVKDAFLEILPSLIVAAGVLLIGTVIIKIIEKFVGKWIYKSKVDTNAQSFLHSILRVILWAIEIVIILSVLHVPITSIVAILGAAGIAISLALQSSLANLSGGFIILFTKCFQVGDTIEVDGLLGKVDRITIMNTRLITPDNKSVYLPNGELSNSRVTNYTEEAVRRLDLYFSIAYENDFRQAITIIEDIAANNPLTQTTNPPVVRLNEHSASALVIVAQLWVAAADYWPLRYDMMESVKQAFDENNINIPYTKVDINVISKTSL